MKCGELADEFEETAEQLEIIAKQYEAKGMMSQYEILWHEGAVYRYCALRLREEKDLVMMNEMTSKMIFTINYRCLFCGNQWAEEDDIFEQDRDLAVSGCRACVPPLETGILVKYGSPERAPADAVYADHHLQRDGIYTISKVRRWQHGAYVCFRETGDKQFNFRLFVPRAFTKTVNSEDVSSVGAVVEFQAEMASIVIPEIIQTCQERERLANEVRRGDRPKD
jgi:hypothetical protein